MKCLLFGDFALVFIYFKNLLSMSLAYITTASMSLGNSEIINPFLERIKIGEDLEAIQVPR